MIFDPHESTTFKWAEALTANTAALSLYGCPIEGLRWPEGPDLDTRTCLPATGRRLQLTSSSSPEWVPTDAPSPLAACSTCDQFPLRHTGVSTTVEIQSEVRVDAAVMLDEDTVLLAVVQPERGEEDLRTTWLGRRGNPALQRMTLIFDPATVPYHGVTALTLVGGRIVGAGEPYLFELRMDGDRIEVSLFEPDPIDGLVGDIDLTVAGRDRTDLFALGGTGALLRSRRNSPVAQLTRPRVKRNDDDRVDARVQMVPLGDDGVLTVGVTTSSDSYQLRPEQGPVITAYYAYQFDVGREWPMPNHEEAISVAELQGRGFVLGADGGLVEVVSASQQGRPINGVTQKTFTLARGAFDRVIVTGRDGGIVQVHPDLPLSCPFLPAFPAADILSQGLTFVHVARSGLEVSWYEVVPVQACALDPWIGKASPVP